jgi:delta 1-pyrroline-5-carboxylate dehydrogenase
MLSDIVSECKNSRVGTAASASLAVALAWAHVGEHNRAKSMHQEAALLDCKEPSFLTVLERSALALGVA